MSKEEEIEETASQSRKDQQEKPRLDPETAKIEKFRTLLDALRAVGRRR